MFDMSTRFDTIHERVGRRTDGRTDRRTDTARQHRLRLCITYRAAKSLDPVLGQCSDLQGVPIKSDPQQCFVIISITTGNFDANFFVGILPSVLHHKMPSFVDSSSVCKL